MDLDKIWDLDLASQRHHFCKVLSKSVMVGLNQLVCGMELPIGKKHDYDTVQPLNLKGRSVWS